MTKQVLFSAALTTANMVLGFVVAAVLASLLGASGYGVYTLVAVVFAILSILTQVGIPKLAMRETARALKLKEWPIMLALWRWAGTRVTAMSLSVSVVAVALVWTLPIAGLSEHRSVVAMAALLVPLASLGALRGAILRGLGHVILGQLPESGLRNVFFLMILLGLWSWQSQSSPFTAMSANVAATLFAFVVGAFILLMKAPSDLQTVHTRSPIDKTWMRAAAFMGVSAGLNQINNYSDILILGVFRSSDEIGVYRIVYQVSTLVVFGLQAVSLVVAPALSRAHATNDKIELQRLVRFSSSLAIVVALPVALLFLVFGEKLLAMVFGLEFSTGQSALIVLAVAQLINASFGSVGVLMNMTRNETALTQAMGVTAVVNVVLNFALVPFFGMIGAAIATLASISIWNSLLFLAARRKLGVSSHVFSYRRGGIK